MLNKRVEATCIKKNSPQGIFLFTLLFLWCYNDAMQQDAPILFPCITFRKNTSVLQYKPNISFMLMYCCLIQPIRFQYPGQSCY